MLSEHRSWLSVCPHVLANPLPVVRELLQRFLIRWSMPQIHTTGTRERTAYWLAFLKSYVIIPHELLEDVDVEAVTNMEKWVVLNALLLTIAH